jgi:hypothetical protein
MNDYADAVRTLEQHVRQEPDGTFTLVVEDIGIDPLILSDLKRSMEQTNRHVLAGDYQVGDVWQWDIPAIPC